MVEYAWRQPDGEIAPVLQTEGYTLLVKSGDDWVPVEAPNPLQLASRMALDAAERHGFQSARAQLEQMGWTRPGGVVSCLREHADEGTHTNGYVVAADAFELAVKRVGNTVPRDELRDLARWFYAEMLALAQTGTQDRA